MHFVLYIFDSLLNKTMEKARIYNIYRWDSHAHCECQAKVAVVSFFCCEIVNWICACIRIVTCHAKKKKKRNLYDSPLFLCHWHAIVFILFIISISFHFVLLAYLCLAMSSSRNTFSIKSAQAKMHSTFHGAVCFFSYFPLNLTGFYRTSCSSIYDNSQDNLS